MIKPLYSKLWGFFFILFGMIFFCFGMGLAYDHKSFFTIQPEWDIEKSHKMAYKLIGIDNINLYFTYLDNILKNLDINNDVLKLQCIQKYKKISNIILSFLSLDNNKILDLEACKIMCNDLELIFVLIPLERKKKVTIICAQKNCLKCLPDSIVQFRCLKYLNLNFNRFRCFSRNICRLKNLEVLNFSCNKLTSISPFILNLKNLISLNLASNNLNYLSGSIGFLNSLRELNLINNDLMSLPSQIWKLKKLETISLGYNSLEHLEPFPKAKKDVQLWLNKKFSF